MIAPGGDHWRGNEWLNSLTILNENPVQPAHPIPLAFPEVAPGCADTREAVDNNVFHCIHGCASGILLRETAKLPAVELLGGLRP